MKKDPRAWIRQASSDNRCMQYLKNIYGGKAREGSDLCQVVAKAQQTVEKSIKSIILAVIESRIGGIQVNPDRWSHVVSAYVSTFKFEFKGYVGNSVHSKISAFFEAIDLRAIKILDKMVPTQKDLGRNTEYPYNDSGRWWAPCDRGVFELKDIERLTTAASNTFSSSKRIVDMLTHMEII